jgi:hypothetical protein
MALLERDAAIREESRWLMKGGFERCTGDESWKGEKMLDRRRLLF